MLKIPLRVLFVSHTYVVGVNQSKLNAIAQTDEIEVGLLTPNNWKALEWNRLLPIEKPYPKIHIYPAPVLFTGRGGAHFYAPWKIWEVLKDFQPDLIQVEEEVFSLCAFELSLFSKFTGKPLVVFGWKNINRQLSFLRRWVRQFVLNQASLIIAGNSEGGDLLRLWGYKGLIEIMPQMGVDTDIFSPELSQTNQKHFQIGYLGRLVYAKGIDILFAALRRLQKWGYDCRLILCGSGSDEEKLRQEAEKQGIANLVIWRGAVTHAAVPLEMSQFDVLVLPSRSTPSWKEQFGHVLIEAMAMGIPVVGSNSGEIPQVIGRSDLVFQEEDSQDLASILAKMIQDPNWREQIKNYSLKRIENCYSHQRIAQRLINLWQKIL